MLPPFVCPAPVLVGSRRHGLDPGRASRGFRVRRGADDVRGRPLDSHGHALGGRHSWRLSSCASGDHESSSGAVAGVRSHALRQDTRGDGHAEGSAWIRTRLSVSRFPFRSRRSDRGCFASTISKANCRRTSVSLGARRCSTARGRPQCSSSRPGRSIVRATSARPAARPTRPSRAARADASSLAEVVPPDSLPDSWIDYSGLDFLAISRDDLAHLKPTVRRAVLKWVHCGGNLIVHQAGKTSKDVKTLERLLELNENAAVGARWTESGGAVRAPPFATRQLMLGLVSPSASNCPFRRSPGRHS